MRAILDWYSLATDSLFSGQGKLATIWFDQLVLQIPSEDLLHRVISSFKKDGSFSNETADALSKIWVPAQKIVPGWSFVDPGVWDRVDEETGQLLHEAMQNQIRKQYGDEVAGSYGEAREIALGGAGYLSAIEIWKELNKSEPSIFVANEFGAPVLEKVIYQRLEDSIFGSFSKVASVPIPNLSNIGWDKILELRNNRYFGDFRKTLKTIHDRIAKANENEVREMILELKLGEMESIVRSNEPSVGTAALNGVLDNIPGLPANPYSIWKSTRDVLRAKDRKKKSGWLYFLLKMEDVSKHKAG